MEVLGVLQLRHPLEDVCWDLLDFFFQVVAPAHLHRFLVVSIADKRVHQVHLTCATALGEPVRKGKLSLPHELVDLLTPQRCPDLLLELLRLPQLRQVLCPAPLLVFHQQLHQVPPVLVAPHLHAESSRRVPVLHLEESAQESLVGELLPHSSSCDQPCHVQVQLLAPELLSDRPQALEDRGGPEVRPVPPEAPLEVECLDHAAEGAVGHAACCFLLRRSLEFGTDSLEHPERPPSLLRRTVQRHPLCPATSDLVLQPVQKEAEQGRLGAMAGVYLVPLQTLPNLVQILAVVVSQVVG
mmetsp:Transcript_51949/g.161584  ORF Transcript_51949/g.161584 Transcript_51949/m.161584 type:complete len:298 (+) Transcript_51949:1177-2070(+)